MKWPEAYKGWSLLGGCLIVVGLSLPLWSRNGHDVNGWDGQFLSIGRWVLLASAILANAIAFHPLIRRPGRIAVPAALALLQSVLILWKGYKLHAIGWGAWVLLIGGALLMLSAVLLHAYPKLPEK
ncbi:MAG: hypothetical protein RLZZ165_993 [Bacteroidota bacterium]|jgi:hypothetical protein